ncbi:hypothetical protein ScPMuIL_015560 [Solemya velum]
MLRQSVTVSALPLTRKLPTLPSRTALNSSYSRLDAVRNTIRSWIHTKAKNEHAVTLRKCYGLLGVSEDCSQEELRQAYLRLAKQYHPDSGSRSADTDRFAQVEEAYKAIKKQRKLQETTDPEQEVIFDIKHTAPQHRQYLDFEGFGIGTPSMRQRQYQQYRVSKASENVYEHKIQKLAFQSEDLMVVKDKRESRRAKMSNAIERLVEDLIQESMMKGEFDNLHGKGRPLEYSNRNPMVDTDTHNINKILINNGYVPEWVTLEKEIRDELDRARQSLTNTRQRLGEPPLCRSAEWSHAIGQFQTAVSDINTKIDRFNLLVPIMTKQKIRYNSQKELKRILENHEKYRKNTRGSDGHSSNIDVQHAVLGNVAIDWKDVWKNIRELFQTYR